MGWNNQRREAGSKIDMRGAHGDKNCEKKPKKYIKMILTCDKRYDAFDLKRKINHFIEDLIFQNFEEVPKGPIVT